MAVPALNQRGGMEKGAHLRWAPFRVRRVPETYSAIIVTMRRWRSALGVVLVALLLGSCTGDEGRPQGSVSGTPSPRAVTGVDTEKAGLEVGVPYRIELYTHCGIDFWTRFDGSYWDAVNYDNSTGNPPPGLGNPYDLGTMTLLSEEEAQYVSESGKVIGLVRAGKRPSGMVCF
jgi:hypothetical protein